MSELLLRITALTTVFFVLFLLAGSKAGKAAVWFGLLVDLGIVYTAANQNVLQNMASLLSNTAVGGGTITLTSAGGGGNLEQPEPPPGVVLPVGTPETGPQTA
jgi:ABC-type multidrug transport system permease subunit